MPRSLFTPILLAVLLLTTGVGVVDAALEGARDHLVIFSFALCLVVVLGVAFLLGHPWVPMRGDLVRWATRRAHLTGEPVEDIIDRAVAGYRSLLEPQASGMDAGHAAGGHAGPNTSVSPDPERVDDR